MDNLIKSISCQDIERITGEKPEKIKRWKKGITKIPEPVIRLLRLYIKGEASALLGKDWEGHYFKNNLLYIPEWRRGLTSYEIRTLFWQCQQVTSLKNEIRLLKKEIERRNKEINALELKADFYRRQVILAFDAPTFDGEFDDEWPPLIFYPLSPQSIYFVSTDQFHFDPPLPLPNTDAFNGILSLYAFSDMFVEGHCPFFGLSVLNSCGGQLTDLSVKLRESPNSISLPSSLLLAGGISALWLLAKAALRRRAVRPALLPTTTR